MRGNKLGIINRPVAPINLYPSFDSVIADEGLHGAMVKIVERTESNWYYIETHYDYQGYIHESNISFDEERVSQWMAKADKQICHSLVDVMPEASYKSYVKEVLTRGARVIATGNEKDGWAEIQLVNGSIGWIRLGFMENEKAGPSKKSEDELRRKLVRTAKSYIGTQYRWGGKSPFGIDCSGLCSISYLLNGVTIYRDAQLKEKYMMEISIDEMKAGDLIFFPGHVAMYIGNDKFVHSSSSLNGVRINSLNPKDDVYKEDLANTIVKVGTIF